MCKRRRGFFTFCRERALQQTKRCGRIVGIAEEVEIFAADHAMTDQRVEVYDLFPVFRAVEKNQDPAVQLLGLLQCQYLRQFVEGAEASGKNHQRTREVREPKLAHEKIAEFEGQLASDVGVGPLLLGQSYVETDSPPTCLRGAPIRRLHNPAPTARADHISMCMRGETFGPRGDESRELSGLLVIATERTVWGKPGRPEENDSFVDALASKTAQRLEVLREYAQRTSVLALEEALVFVCKQGMHHLERFHD